MKQLKCVGEKTDCMCVVVEIKREKLKYIYTGTHPIIETCVSVHIDLKLFHVSVQWYLE